MFKVIETNYKGFKFRSRLEARWAVFFDSLGIKYEYEPEGFKDNNGNYYLPDFYLPEVYLRNGNKGVYIEIKPANHDTKKTDNLFDWFEKPLVIFLGRPDQNIWGGWDNEDQIGGIECWKGCWDYPMYFWICNSNQNCNTVKIEFAEGNYDNCPECEGECNSTYLEFCANLAKGKRFEYKERDY